MTVDFLNDAYGGTSYEDRNLYVEFSVLRRSCLEPRNLVTHGTRFAVAHGCNGYAGTYGRIG